MNCAIYVRVSTQQQAEKGYSLQTQEDACRKKAEEMGATSIKIYRDDGYSGAYLERPALDSLRDAVAQKLHDCIIIYDIDRLSRDTMHLLLLTEEMEKNARLVYINSEYSKTPEGQLFFEIRGSFAKYERVKIQDRFQRGKRGKLRKGLPVSDHHVLGYSWKGGNYVINEAQAGVVRSIFDRYINHLGGIQSVANWLNGQNIPSPQGVAWSSTGVQRILTRQMYTGEYYAYKEYHKKVSATKFEKIARDSSEWIPMSCPAIIDMETYNQAQDKLHRNKTLKIHETDHVALFSGVLYCADCGRKMLPVWNTKRTYRYYQCFSRVKKTPCKNHTVSVDVLDTMVWDAIKKACRNETMLKKYVAQNQPKLKDESESIKKDLAGIEAKRQAIMNWFSANLISAEESTTKLQALKKQEQMLTEKLSIKKSTLATDQIVKDAKKRKITQEEKRQFVLNHIARVDVLRKDFVNRYDVDLDITINFKS